MNYKRWMTNNQAVIGDYKMRDLIILGSHDDEDVWKQVLAITDELYEPWSQNHNKDILTQLNEGIRSIVF